MTKSIRYLDLTDFLLIAEAVLGVDAQELAYAARLDLAESALAAPAAAFEGHEFYAWSNSWSVTNMNGLLPLSMAYKGMRRFKSLKLSRPANWMGST